MASTASSAAVPQPLAAGTVPIQHAAGRRFYVRMAAAIVFIAVAGFIPTYWAPVARGSFSGAPILHAHGLLFTAWTLVFLAQARFAAAGRFEHHRMLGLAGVSLATAMLLIGIGVSVHSMRGGIAEGFELEARTFSIVPVTIIVFFAAVVAVAIASIRRPEVHMRLMLVATISMLPPALARMVRLLAGAPPPGMGAPPPVAFSLVPNLLADLLIVVAIVHDWRTRGRPHPAYLIAGGALLAVQVVRVPLSGTAAWHAVTDWLLRFGGG